MMSSFLPRLKPIKSNYMNYQSTCLFSYIVMIITMEKTFLIKMQMTMMTLMITLLHTIELKLLFTTQALSSQIDGVMLKP